MLFFKKILNSRSESTSAKEKRLASRFPVGSEFPVKAQVCLIGRDAIGRLVSKKMEDGRYWAGKLINVSSGGAQLSIPASALTGRGDPSSLRLSVGEDSLELPCEVAHFKPGGTGAHVGVNINFKDETSRKAYLQLIEPVAMGSSLAPVAASKVKQDVPGLSKQQYSGDNNCTLSVWRRIESAALYGFEIIMQEYVVRWSEGQNEMDIQRAGGGKALTDAQRVEVQWLFCLTVPNVSEDVPQDVREFLGQLVS
jgi:hypothetical protein